MQYPVVIIPDLVEQSCQQGTKKTSSQSLKSCSRASNHKFDEKELHIQEERRLFYVAITRAKEKLIITYAKTIWRKQNRLQTIKIPNRNRIQAKRKHRPSNKLTLQDLSPESTTKENQTQTHLMKQVISNLTTGKFSDAIENVLLFRQINKQRPRHQSRINSEIKEPDYSHFEQADEEACHSSRKPCF